MHSPELPFSLNSKVPVKTRMEKYTEKRGLHECWEWKASRSDNGYGGIRIDGKTWKAHQIAYILRFGPIPPNAVIMHLCNNKGCVNPGHLYAGTSSNNAEHRELSGRGRPQQGELSNSAILTDKAALYILTSNKSIKELARELGVKYQTVWGIKARRTYKHLTEDLYVQS